MKPSTQTLALRLIKGYAFSSLEMNTKRLEQLKDMEQSEEVDLAIQILEKAIRVMA